MGKTSLFEDHAASEPVRRSQTYEFRNPANGHRESVSGLAGLWTLLFGALYLLIKGLWAHALIWVAIAGVGALATDTPIPAVLASIGYAMCVRKLLRNRYLHKGWAEVRPGPEQSASKPAASPSTGVTPNSPKLNSNNMADDLERLAQLRARGDLTDAEFRAAKARLLNHE